MIAQGVTLVSKDAQSDGTFRPARVSAGELAGVVVVHSLCENDVKRPMSLRRKDIILNRP